MMAEPATDKQIAGWRETWFTDETRDNRWQSLIARIEAEKARADKAQSALADCGERIAALEEREATLMDSGIEQCKRIAELERLVAALERRVEALIRYGEARCDGTFVVGFEQSKMVAKLLRGEESESCDKQS